MASSYKYFADHDRVVANNSLEEIISNEKGTEWMSSSNPPNYFMQVGSGSTVWATSTHVFDLTYGRSSQTVTSSTDDFSAEKNIYNQFAKVLLGHNSDGSIKKFNLDPDDNTGAKVLHNAYFVNFSRSQFKDKIREGSFELNILVSGSNRIVDLKDSGSSGVTKRECQSGEYSLLYASEHPSSPSLSIVEGVNDVQGLLFYEAGVAVVSPYIFSKYDSNDNPSGSDEYIAANKLGILLGTADANLSGSQNIGYLVTSGSILNNNYALATHILTASYQSTTELNSAIYFCRAYNHEFNYSSNPTYLNNSKIVVKGDNPEAAPRTYITTVGLYSDDNQLLAVAKLSEPVLKTPENELIARVRLDF